MNPAKNNRAALINSGIVELGQHGIRKFSLRRVAARCGVSCAAPYKHFESKEQFLSEIFKEIAEDWHLRQESVMRNGDPTESLPRLVVEYITFMSENPGYANLIVMNDESLGDHLRKMKDDLTQVLRKNLREICDRMGYSDEVYHAKLFALRSTIYGAVVMLTADDDNNYTKSEVIRLTTQLLNSQFSDIVHK